LDAKTPYKVKAFVPLDNALVANPEITTGDHDGIAVLVEAHWSEFPLADC